MSLIREIAPKFCTAVQEGNFAEVSRIMESSEFWKSMVTNYDLLYQALVEKHLNIVKLFLRQGYIVNIDSEEKETGNSILHLAVIHGDSEIVKIILNQSISPKSINQKGEVPLHQIVYRNNADSVLDPTKFNEESSMIIDSLLNCGLDIDIQVESHDKNKYTALHLAAEYGNEQITNILLNKNANINAFTESKFSALHLATIAQHVGIVKILLQFGAQQLIGKLRETPLHIAIRNGAEEICRLLLDHGADVSYPATYPTDGFHFQHLLKFSPNESVSTTYPTMPIFGGGCGATPLRLAVRLGNAKMVDILLNYICEDNSIIDFRKSTIRAALNFAVYMGSEDVVNLLLFSRKIINESKICILSSLLHLKNNKVSILKILLHVFHTVDTSLSTYENYAFYRTCMSLNYEATKVFCDVYSRNSQKWKIHYYKYPIEVNIQRFIYRDSEPFLRLFLTECLCNKKNDVDYLKSIDISKTDCFAFISAVMVIREALGRYVNKSDLEVIEYLKEYSVENNENPRFKYNECKNELKYLRCRKLRNNISLFDILSKNSNKLAGYVRNKNLLQDFELIGLENEFPYYALILQTRIEEAKKRKILLDSNAEHLKSVCEINFPSIVVYEILNYLSSSDLENLAEVFS